MPEANVANKTIISLENFLEKMTEKYKQDFIDKVTEHSDGSIDQTRADDYFRTFVKALYNNRVEGIGPGYGYFYEGGAAGEKGRQNLVEAFHAEVSEFIRAFGPVAAQGSTLLWSSYAIGRFAAEDKEILRSAGVTDENAETLNKTEIGELWDKLKITTEMDEQIGYIWDNQYHVWASVSKEFASNAKGEVHVFLPKNIAASTVFWNVELPELRKNMAEFTQKPESEQVTKITIHRLTNDALKRVNDAADDNAKRQVMLDSSSWQNLDFSEATLEVPKFSDKQNKLLEDSNPLLFTQMDNYVRNNQTGGAITISKLTEIARRWRDKASGNVELYRKIADKYGHFASVPFDTAQNIAKGQGTNSEIKQYGDKLVNAFQNDLSTKEPQDYNDSDLEIITPLLYDNYTRLQQASSIEMSTKVISKTELANLLKTSPGALTLGGFSNFNQYSKKLSARETIERFGLNYQYQDASGQTVKPYQMSVGGRDQALPFVYYVTTPITNEIKDNAKIPLDPTVKTKLEAIANDANRDNNDELKKMAKELTTPGVYHELTPNTGNNLPRYGTQTDGKKSYAGMLRTTYSPSSSELSPGTMIRARGFNGEDFKIADWNGLTWTLSPQKVTDLPSWIQNQGRPEDRLNFNEELKQWKMIGESKMIPPTRIPAPVKGFMEHHFQTSLNEITIQKVGSLDNDDSTATLIKFKLGEYNDSTEAGLTKIANKLGDALKLKFANNGNQPDISKAITEINKELPTKSVSIKNDLMILRRVKMISDNVTKKLKSRYPTGKTPSVSAGITRTGSRRSR
ncbi:hypothetical protein BJP34_12165 [Moorena producens PAL-8-15-08-1]|uniref:Uncharacterized protein n=1 Tax=Moorena producens PAL-8-15-08-1 TaxID=1458985 RepID=A0A1D8TR28_9CYAN|nr:hypothetical protein [Moorena producens]AOX00099.1 hypothetical protein BJP34_12165 [Moorena producens PAL-8-15-08-1]